MGGFEMTGGDPIIDRYEASIRPEIEARLGKDRVQMNNLHCNIFPNFSWLNPVRTLRVWHPKGPNSMECWSFVFVVCAAEVLVLAAETASDSVRISHQFHLDMT